ncbi:hypothetical protein [Tsukamurella tyrosinosolvens]|uniref:hypothetical protein n=1 Tax=Tsukamurella tyrosinosolvens TaxID=57704 RepID=UPI0007B183EF|nr:hypothetical protein [Tsukamurella tyrosinosolvens]KZL96953.1 hypothetical protein AXX05_15850 [Tsukamurella tyrosinosolvens]MEC4615808.1 hypothetical protein [Tsukamurella tyrosinosolvens]
MKTTTARGLGWQHQQIRRRLIANHRDGTHCWWCNGPMYRDPARNFDGAALEADHSLARSHGGHRADRLLHMTCNRQRQDGSRDHLRPALTGQPIGDTSPADDGLAPRHLPWPW